MARSHTWGASLPPDQRRILAELIDAALRAADPFAAVQRVARRQGDHLTLGPASFDLGQTGTIVVVGAGKAGAPMAAALHDLLGERIADGWVNVKQGYLLPGQETPDRIGRIRVQQAAHPLPDEAGRLGAQRVLELVRGLSEDDLVLCVISGGGSALLPLPADGITLAEKQEVTGALLASGATINEINAVRKHLSAIKGGRLAQAAHPARVVSLILSDVVGSPLDVIASGPTVPDSSTWADAWAVLEKYDLAGGAPASVRGRLRRGMAGELPDTPKPGDPIFQSVWNLIVGENRMAALAAVEQAQALGLRAELLSTYIEGEAREVGRALAGLAKEMARYDQPLARPACLVLGGETTVTLRGDGTGGRNQELALAAALALDGWEGTVLVALATDGTDGPTDAAGAVATHDTAARAARAGLSPGRYLENNDSYHFFERLGDLLLTGPTNTNVNDLIFICAF